MESIAIPDSVETIGNRMFTECEYVEVIGHLVKPNFVLADEE